MHTLIVVAHPKRESLTHSVAAHIAEGLASAQASSETGDSGDSASCNADSCNTYEIADLATEASYR